MSNGKYKYMFSITVMISLLLVFTGCPKKEKVQKSITIWAMGEEGLKLPELVKLFNKEYPDIEVEIQQIPWSAAHEKLVTSVVGKIVPDVCQLGTTWMSEFHSMGALEPLDEYIKNSSVVKPENYFKGSLDSCIFDNKIYGIPWYVDVRVMFYRKDLFDKEGVKSAPKTWDEMIKVGEKLTKDKDGDGKIDEYAYTLGIHWQELCPFIWQNDGEIVDIKNRKALVQDKKVKEAIEFIVMLHKKKLVPTGISGIDLVHAFRTGYYKTFFSGPWMLELLKREAPEITGKWDVAIMPKKVAPVSFVGGCNLVIFKDAKNKNLAWKFIEFVNRPEIQIEWYKITTDLPAVKNAWKDEYFSDKPMLKVFEQQLEFAKSPPNIPEWEQVTNVFHNRVEEIILGKKSIDEALKHMETEINSILKR